MPRADGQGMVPAVEVLVSTARVREYVADQGEVSRAARRHRAGHTTYGMQTFDQSLMSLFRSGLITYDEALAQCHQPRRLRAQGARHRLDQRLDVGQISRRRDAGRRWPGRTRQDRALLRRRARRHSAGDAVGVTARDRWRTACSRARPRSDAEVALRTGQPWARRRRRSRRAGEAPRAWLRRRRTLRRRMRRAR